MLSDLDINIAASTGIDDLNIADSAYDPRNGFVWAVDTEYGLIKLDLHFKKFVGMPVERLEGGLVIVCAAVDGGAYGLTQRDGCVVKFASDLSEVASFTARGAVDVSADATGVSAIYIVNGRLEAAKLGDDGKEVWRTAVCDIAGFPRGYRGTGVFAVAGKTVVVSGDPNLRVTVLSATGEIEQKLDIDLPGGTSGQTGSADGYAVSGRGREDYLIGSAVAATAHVGDLPADRSAMTAAMLYRSPVDPQRLVVISVSLADAEPKPVAFVVKESMDQLGGFDGDRLLCIGGSPGKGHGRIFTTRLADLESTPITELSQAPSKARWWDKYKLKFNVDGGLNHADEIVEEQRNFGGQDIRY